MKAQFILDLDVSLIVLTFINICHVLRKAKISLITSPVCIILKFFKTTFLVLSLQLISQINGCLVILCDTWPNWPRSHSEVLVKTALEDPSAQFPSPGNPYLCQDTFGSLMKSTDPLSEKMVFLNVLLDYIENHRIDSYQNI